MSDKKSLLRELISGLKQQRDELALQMHLGKAEAKEEWEKVEQKWHELSAEYEPVKDAVGETAENVVAGLELIAHEVKSGFERVRQLITKDEKEDEAG